jgi:hypothetical protein
VARNGALGFAEVCGVRLLSVSTTFASSQYVSCMLSWSMRALFHVKLQEMRYCMYVPAE